MPDNGLARTPPMGRNRWSGLADGIEREVLTGDLARGDWPGHAIVDRITTHAVRAKRGQVRMRIQVSNEGQTTKSGKMGQQSQ